jgi:hypothetical protein
MQRGRVSGREGQRESSLARRALAQQHPPTNVHVQGLGPFIQPVHVLLQQYRSSTGAVQQQCSDCSSAFKAAHVRNTPSTHSRGTSAPQPSPRTGPTHPPAVATHLDEHEHAAVQAQPLPHAITQQEAAVQYRHPGLWPPHKVKVACREVGWKGERLSMQ